MSEVGRIDVHERPMVYTAVTPAHLRDQLAMAALSGLVVPGADYEIISRQAYQIADAMLLVRGE